MRKRKALADVQRCYGIDDELRQVKPQHLSGAYMRGSHYVTFRQNIRPV